MDTAPTSGDIIAGVKCAISFIVAALLPLVHVSRAAGPTTAPVEFFPITSWEVPWNKAPGLNDDVVNGIASLRDCGYTVAAFPLAGKISQCQKASLRAIIALPRRIEWRTLSDQQIVETVKELVGDTARSDTVLGYFLQDEPGAQAFAALGKAVAEVKKIAPGKIAYINLYPDYATLGAADISQLGTATYEQYLERFITAVKPQIISYDNYQVEYSHDLSDEKRAESYFRNLLTVRAAAMKHALPFWTIVSSNQIRPGMPPPSPANLSLQAYTALAAGAKGLTWYTYYDRGYHYAPVDRQGHRSRTWAYVRMVNEQVKVLGPILKPLKSEGVYFTRSFKGTPRATLPGKWIADITSSAAAPAMIGEFSGHARGSAQRYAMIVNLSLEHSANFTLKTTNPGVTMRCISPVDGAETQLEAKGIIWLPAGQGALLRIHD